jgi:probable rRNA maturation factor
VNIHLVQEASCPTISEESVKQLVTDFNQFSQAAADEIAIHFVGKERICDLHREYFQDPTPTDCISFPMDAAPEQGYRIMGDIFICPAIAQEYVAAHGGDLYHEITLYLVHGLLHLQGHDDLEEEERKLMRMAEAEYLIQVKEKNLWLSPLKK